MVLDCSIPQAKGWLAQLCDAGEAHCWSRALGSRSAQARAAASGTRRGWSAKEPMREATKNVPHGMVTTGTVAVPSDANTLTARRSTAARSASHVHSLQSVGWGNRWRSCRIDEGEVRAQLCERRHGVFGIRWDLHCCAFGSPTFEVSRRHRLAGGCRLDRRVGAHVFHDCIIAPSGASPKCFLCASNTPQRCAKHKQPSVTTMLGERGVGCSGSRCSYYPSSHCAGVGE